MNLRPAITFWAMSSFLVAFDTTAASGQQTALPEQTVLMKSGYELTGQVTSSKDPDSGRAYVLVRKPGGAILKLDKSLLVRKISSDTVAMVEYRKLAARAETSEHRRQLIAWCLSQPGGRRTFETEIEQQSLQIISVDPDDKEARRRLGYERADNGRWVLKEQFFEEHGYVKDGTSWAPALTAEKEVRDETTDARVAERKALLAQWQRMARRRDVSRADLEQAMFQLCDKYAIDLVDRLAVRSDNDLLVRAICVEAIGRVDSRSAMQRLVRFAMLDLDPEIRERALTLLGQDFYDQQAAAKTLIPFLSSKRPNEQIQRAAFVIGELGGGDVVSELVEVLVTTHTIKNPNALPPGRLNAGFDRTGGTGGGLTTGGGPQTVQRTFENQLVLGTLKSLTGQDFGYDVQQWREWFIQAKTYYSVNVRND